MCSVLQLPKSTFYYEARQRPSVDDVTEAIREIFRRSRENYGTRKIKIELQKQGKCVSRRRIGRIMKEQGLVSTYTLAQFKPKKEACNESMEANELNRAFKQGKELSVIVSDLTYIKVRQKWHYVCVFVDLFNREIIGHSVGERKDAQLVHRAFASIPHDLRRIRMFHTDRGREFNNRLIEDALHTFGIRRSLSEKGCPYDNAVAEATFKIIKTEFVKKRVFSSLMELEREFQDYVNWFNHLRIHGTLDYQSPVHYKQSLLKKIV